MKKLFLIIRYLKYRIKSKSKFKIHSPFVYDLITKVFYAEIPIDIAEKVWEKRKKLFSNNTVLETVDFGVGSVSKGKIKSKYSSYKAEFKTVKKIAKSAMFTQKQSDLMFNLIHHFKPKVVVELGTSLGITTSMMALAAPCSKFYSMEGCASIASVAQQNLKKLGVKNVTLKLGEFDTVIPEVIESLKTVDFVLFDGNHRKKATLNYFEKFLPLKNNDTIFVFDDIYWSKGMCEAWEAIKNHPDTVVTIDLFYMGLVFFRKELTPQHFVYRF